MASTVYIIDEANRSAIDYPKRLDKIKQFLSYVLKGDRGMHSANTAVSVGSILMYRRLHQMMYADRDYDKDVTNNSSSTRDRSKPLVTVENCANKGYILVSFSCTDRPKLLFDTIFTPTDMKYIVYHDAIMAGGQKLGRHINIHCLEASIRRRTSEGIRLELGDEDWIGLISHVTFRKNGLSVTLAEVTTWETQAVNAFYVTDTLDYAVKNETIEAICDEINAAHEAFVETSRFSHEGWK